MKSSARFVFVILFAAQFLFAAETSLWPPVTRTQKPWAYWWWLASAVDETNLTPELIRYADAGYGGVHIIPIYGAKGAESNAVEYLSPRWMELLHYTVNTARRLDMDVDMTTGTGWCFGGPTVSSNDANASVVLKAYDVPAGAMFNETFPAPKPQALVAFTARGVVVDLTEKIRPDGVVDWKPPGVGWKVFAVSQRPSGQQVKRAAPGGEGPMLNLFYPDAMRRYLRRFDAAFADYSGPRPRAQYHDSYEYKSDWSPDFFAQFAKRRGYQLQTELPALFSAKSDNHALRVLCDYRETVSDVMIEDTLPQWAAWSHAHGFITRNEAHGSPGNLLDLYAVADIPETEYFKTNRNPLIAKFASSAAHVKGGNLVSAEAGTWLAEHFTETLADVKYLMDDFFVSGVNHVFYHDTCYSPDAAGWPGWLFYAATEMNPRNPIWHDAPTLNNYIARVQAVLQSGKSDNDVLLYWPVYDFWNGSVATNRLPSLRVEAPAWFEEQHIGKTAHELWNRGYAFDYVSDRQLAKASVANGKVRLGGGNYRVVVVPPCEFMPVDTLQKLLALAKDGAVVVFENALPNDVPGLGDLDKRRAKFKKLVGSLKSLSMWNEDRRPAFDGYAIGEGRIFVGIKALDSELGSLREPMVDSGLSFVRRAFAGGWNYFIANRGTNAVDEFIPLARRAQSVALMDAMTGRVGLGTFTNGSVRLQLAPGESVIVRTFAGQGATGVAWTYERAMFPGNKLEGEWRVEFLSGGPVLPASFTAANLGSWTEASDTNAQSFAGTARYTLNFDYPSATLPTAWSLSLGKVCQSARVKLNGKDYGTLITPPFRVVVDNLKPKDNLLEVEVTSVAANRIRDLDRRGVQWKNFRDINFVNKDYKPFDASVWPLTDSGLLGPVGLTAVALEK